MSNQSFIYNTDTGGFKEQIFNVKKPVLLRGAGLTGCVPIYMMVGDCPSCRPEDILWEPVMSCGDAVELCPDDNQLMITIPGRYSIGDPNDPSFVVPGIDVNITKQEGVDPSLMGKCDGGSVEIPNPIQIDSSCTEPVHVEICNPNLVETSMAELGCITDATGDVIGKVMLCKITNELDGTQIVTQTAYYEDGTVLENYSGPWSVCGNNPCLGETPIGVITDLTLLIN